MAVIRPKRGPKCKQPRFKHQAISLRGTDWALIMLALDSESENTTQRTGELMTMLAARIRSQIRTDILTDLVLDSQSSQE
jgi:hypothetical protein